MVHGQNALNSALEANIFKNVVGKRSIEKLILDYIVAESSDEDGEKRILCFCL